MRIGLVTSAEFEKYDTKEVLGRYTSYWEKFGHEIVKYQFGDIIRSLYSLVKFYKKKQKPDLLIVVADVNNLVASLFVSGKKVLLFTDNFIESYKSKKRYAKILMALIIKYLTKSNEIINFATMPLPMVVIKSGYTKIYKMNARLVTEKPRKVVKIMQKQKILYFKNDNDENPISTMIEILLILKRKSEEWGLVLYGNYKKSDLDLIKNRAKELDIKKSVKVITKLKSVTLTRLIGECISVVNICDDFCNLDYSDELRNAGTSIVVNKKIKFADNNLNFFETKGKEAYYFAEAVLELWKNKDNMKGKEILSTDIYNSANELKKSLQIIESI